MRSFGQLPPMLYPHHYSALFRLATLETDETAPGGKGREGQTVRDLHPGPSMARRRSEVSTSLRVLERLGLVERCGRKDWLVVWQTTARGYETVFPS